MLIMISACKTASARKVTAVVPLFPYSRQPDIPFSKLGAPKTASTSNSNSHFTFDSVPGSPRTFPRTGVLGKAADIEGGGPSAITLAAAMGALKDKQERGSERAERPAINGSSSRNSSVPQRPPPLIRHDSWVPEEESRLENNTGYKQWVAQSGTLIASLLTCAGADHIITMDLHDPQFQGFFDIPVDNLYGKPLLQHYITSSIPDYQEAVIVSPDAGGAKRATAIADSLAMPFALIHKERRNNMPGKRHNATTMLVGDVAGRVALLIDDLVDTANTITRAAKLLKDQGAVKVYAIITHAIFSGDAIERIKASSLDKIVTTNSTPQQDHQQKLGSKLEVLDVSRVFAEAIRRIHNGESVSMLFDHVGF